MTEVPSSGGPARRLADFLAGRGVRTRVLAPFTFDALIIGTNLITGVIVARALGPSGRGEIAAILTIVVTATWIFSLGNTEAITYRQSRHPEEAPQLIGLWMTMVLVMGVLAIVVAELILPTLFSAQTAHAITLGRIYIPVIIFGLMITACNGVMLADQDFLPYNIVRSVPPLTIVVGYLVCLALDVFTVEAALIINAAGLILASVGITIRSLRKHSIAWPERGLVRKSLSFGIRASLGSVASFVNGRLDLVILPAFLSAGSVGLYSVATNVSSLIPTLTGTIAVFAFPIAAKADKASARVVIRTMHATLGIGLVIAIFIFIVAEFAVPRIYGADFDGAVAPMRIMLGAGLLDSGAIALLGGLLAANRPLLSSAGAAPAAVLTVIGLLLFLESGGIIAAAWVTLTAYSVSFVVFVVLYKRTLNLRWRHFLPPGPPASAVIDDPEGSDA